jgi:acyl-CoA synthetase (NDP forming)
MSTFTGDLYSVQIDPNEITGIEELGVPNYQSLLEIPGDVDYVLVAVPRVAAMAVLRDCAAKDVAGAAFFTSGFAETRDDEAIALQHEFTAFAREAGIAVIGPNCMGLYNPALGVRFREDQAVHFEGDVAIISQSGGLAGDISLAAQASNVPLHVMVSFGNGVVVNAADYLEHFTADPETRYIGVYLEGIQDGPRLLSTLRETTREKPVLLWKGGMTDAGRRAAASHTASLAASDLIWDAMCRQFGAIQVNSADEMVDVIGALRMLPPFTGTGLGITGGSGGQSVAMADVFAGNGLSVPPLRGDTQEQLAGWFSLVGASFGNPIDMGSNRREVDAILDALAGDGGVDVLVVQVRPPADDNERERAETQIEALTRVRERTEKPVVVVAHSPTPAQDGAAVARLAERLQEARIPTFRSYERAASVLSKIGAYYRFLGDTVD